MKEKIRITNIKTIISKASERFRYYKMFALGIFECLILKVRLRDDKSDIGVMNVDMGT